MSILSVDDTKPVRKRLTRKIKDAQRRGKRAAKERRRNAAKALKVDLTTVIGVRLLNLAEICALTGWSRTTIWRYSREGRFPRPMMLGEKRPAWAQTDIIAHFNEKRAEAGLPALPNVLA